MEWTRSWIKNDSDRDNVNRHEEEDILRGRYVKAEGRRRPKPPAAPN